MYGSDADIVDAATTSLASLIRQNSVPPLEYTRLTASDLAQDPTRVFDHFSNVSLFGGGALLRLDAVTEASGKFLTPMGKELAVASSPNRMIISTSELRRGSKTLTELRKYPDIILLTAYESGLTKRDVVAAAEARGLRLTQPDAARQLTDYAEASGPALFHKALEKLSLAGSSEVDDALLSMHLPEASMTGADLLVQSLFSGKSSNLLARLEAHRAAGEDDGRFLAQLARLCLDIKRAQPGHAATRHRPLFWKTEKAARAAQQRLDRFSDRMETALMEIQHAERVARSNPLLTSTIAERLCLRLARCFAGRRP